MFKRKTSRPRRADRQVLALRVTTPRIVWFRLRDLAWCGLKWSFGLALAAAAVWGAAHGLRRAFLENEDFRLQAIDLNPNRVLDERALVEWAGIDLKGSLFAVDIDRVERVLEARPELVDARVERKLPGTLVVRVHERVPLAWLECPAHGLTGRDPAAGMLLDPNRVLFPCVPGMRAQSGRLPVLALQDPATPRPVAGRPIASPELERCLRLLRKALPVAEAGGWTIDRMTQANAWSLRLTTGDGVEAVFGLGDHERQLADLGAVLAHAAARGQQLATVNLIPERNLPVTLGGPPQRAIPVEGDFLPPLPPEGPVARPPAVPDRVERDLKALLNRG
jgi:hypothetical protein